MALTDLERYQPFWRLFAQLESGTDAVGVGTPTGESLDGIIYVAPYNKIRIRIVGTDAANETGTFKLVGYHTDGGPQTAYTCAVILGALSNHVFTGATWRDENISANLTGTVLEVDTYTESFEEISGFGVPSTQVVDGANFVTIDLTNSQYTWLQLVTTKTTAATLGGIWCPVELKKDFGPLNIA
jgi:hypothetical protein